jgi:preprotein translocase subunit SecG
MSADGCSFKPDISEVMRHPPQPASLLFRLTAVAAGVFVVTILALIAVVIGNSQSPGARWLNRNAGAVFAVEVGAILGLGFAAMAQDRRQTQREQRDSGPSAKNENQDA